MDAATPQSTLPGFSDALMTCLQEDAHVRADARQLKVRRDEALAAAKHARESSALPGRLLAALGRRKDGPPTPEEAAELFARENVLQRQGEESDRVIQYYTEELDAHLDAYLLAAMPAYVAQRLARVRLAAWEGLIAELQGDLRELTKALGQARNNAAAGYDRATHKISFTARELFVQADGLISRIEQRVEQANAKANELGGLPGVSMIPLRETVHGLTRLDMATMQLDADRLARELEHFERRQLVDLQVPAVEAADAQVAQARAYLATYREQLRAYYDGQVKPDETAQAIPLILDRYRRR